MLWGMCSVVLQPPSSPAQKAPTSWAVDSNEEALCINASLSGFAQTYVALFPQGCVSIFLCGNVEVFRCSVIVVLLTTVHLDARTAVKCTTIAH